MGELVIQPEKPIRNVNIYLLLRHGRTAWFDDVAMMKTRARRAVGAPAAIQGRTPVDAEVGRICLTPQAPQCPLAANR